MSEGEKLLAKKYTQERQKQTQYWRSEKWEEASGSWHLFLLVAEDQKDLNLLPPQSSAKLSPSLCNWPQKLFLWPTLLFSPLYKNLDIAHYLSYVEKCGVYFIMVQKGIKTENL